MSEPSLRPRVAVTRKLFASHLQRLASEFDLVTHPDDGPPSPAELAEMLSDVDGAIITGSERINEDALARAKRLKIVASVSVGYNHVDLKACAAHQVIVTNTPDVLTETTADFGFALMMATARRMAEAERWMREGHWQHWALDQMAGMDVYGTTLGILGMGRIGQAIARRAQGFSMRVAYHNRKPLAAALEAKLNAHWYAFDELLRVSDHLIIVLPYSPEVHHMIGARELGLMKPSATLTNIARGGIIDERALVRAVTELRLAGIGLDVYEGEPAILPELLKLDRAVLTPHIASASRPTRQRMADLAIDNVIAVLRGQNAKTPVTQ